MDGVRYPEEVKSDYWEYLLRKTDSISPKRNIGVEKRGFLEKYIPNERYGD